MNVESIAPLSRKEAYRASFPMRPQESIGYDYPTDEDGPVAECVKAYSDYYRTHPTKDREITVCLPSGTEYDEKEPSWYWGA